MSSDPSTFALALPSTIATLTGAGAAILGGWASAHFTARQARRREAQARDERRRVLASLLIDELTNIEVALGSFPTAITRRRFRPLPDTPVLDRMLAIADAFDAPTVITLLSVREMVRAHRRVSKDCHALFRRYRRQPETEARAEAERNLLDVVAGATETAAAVQRTAVTALLDLGGIAIAGDDGTATRRYTSGAVEDTLRWTAVHPAANAEAILAARASLRAAEPADEDRVV
ncbi:MAG TPA: hypothetical protein VIG47_14165 [Gemmatimonadaceae bacterium]|jgi:hypothetical protein